MALIDKTFSEVIDFTRPDSAPYVNSSGQTVTAGVNVPRLTHTTSGQPLGLLLESERKERAVIRNGDWRTPHRGTWVVRGDFDGSIILSGLGFSVEADGEGTIVITYSLSGSKVFSQGRFQYESAMRPTEDFNILDEERAVIARMEFIPAMLGDNEAAAMALGSVDVKPWWAPELLFQYGQDGVWLDPSDHSTLWIDEERTQNATQPGDVIWHIDDKSGNENHFSVETSANRSRLVRWPASAVREGYVRNLLLDTESFDLWGTPAANVNRTFTISGNTVRIVGNSSLTAPRFLSGGSCLRRDIPTLGSSGAPRSFIVDVRVNSGFAHFGMANTGDARAAGATLDSFGVVTTISRAPNTSGLTAEIVETKEEGWLRVLVKATSTSTGSALNDLALLGGGNNATGNTDGPFDVEFRFPDVQDTLSPAPYQRVGAGHWDVTEEGQPDCWGIEANGINNRYVSERGIPEYVDGKVRMLAGQTRDFSVLPSRVIVSNRVAGASLNDVALFPQSAGGYTWISRLGENPVRVDVGNATHETAILDVYLDADAGQGSLRRNEDATLTRIGSAGSVADHPFTVLASATGNYYEGVLWGLILTAYEPDESLWSRVARDWLNSTNMPGVLSDDD